jgi:hypothetical protein
MWFEAGVGSDCASSVVRNLSAEMSSSGQSRPQIRIGLLTEPGIVVKGLLRTLRIGMLRACLPPGQQVTRPLLGRGRSSRSRGRTGIAWNHRIHLEGTEIQWGSSCALRCASGAFMVVVGSGAFVVLPRCTEHQGLCSGRKPIRRDFNCREIAVGG